MHIRWKKRTLRTGRQSGEQLCFCEFPELEIWSPVLMDCSQGQQRAVWYPGPTIRACCKDRRGQAAASWWWEVDRRFRELRELGVDERPFPLEQEGIIRELLTEVVPIPDVRERRHYEASRGQSSLRAHPPFAELQTLGLDWPCDQEELKRKWKKLALKHHPDRAGNQELFRKCERAYQRVLKLLRSLGPV